MPRIARKDILEKFRGMIAKGQPIVGGGAGTGLSAKCEEAGGIDLIVIYNSGRYRMAGRGSLAGILAYGNANEIVVDMAKEVLPVVKKTPVLAGVNGTDPFLLTDHFLKQLGELGFSGVQNFPTVGLIDGTFRVGLEETGMGYGLEVEMIRAARSCRGIFQPASAARISVCSAPFLIPTYCPLWRATALNAPAVQKPEGLHHGRRELRIVDIAWQSDELPLRRLTHGFLDRLEESFSRGRIVEIATGCVECRNSTLRQ